MSTRRVVFLLLEIHFRGPAGAPWRLGVEGVWGLEAWGELSSDCADCILLNVIRYHYSKNGLPFCGFAQYLVCVFGMSFRRGL